MGGVFGKSKKQQSRVTEQDKAVLVSEKFSCFPQFPHIFTMKKSFKIAIKTTKRQN